MEITTELTTGTTMSGTVTVIRTGCVEIMIFIVGTGIATIATTFTRAGGGCSISIVTNEGIIGHTGTMIVAFTNGIADIIVITRCQWSINVNSLDH